MKWIENLLRTFSYFLLRIVLKNKQVQLPLDGSKVKKILILRYDVLGDMIVTTPVFQLLHDKLPNAEIHVLGSTRNVGLLAHDKRINKVLCYEGSWKSLVKLRTIARNEDYDCVIAMVFYKATKAGMWANWIAGRDAVKIAWANPERAYLYTALFNAQLPSHHNDMTMSEIHVQFLCNCFGWKYSKNLVQLGMFIPHQYDEISENYFRQFGDKKNVLINISAGESNRTLTESTVVELIYLLFENYPTIQILLNAAPTDRINSEKICSRFSGNVMTLPYSSDVLQFCSYVKQAHAVVSPDTAIVHIAAAFDIPIVGLYKNSERHCKQWGPQHEKAMLVVPEGENDVNTISARMIFQACNQLFQRYEVA